MPSNNGIRYGEAKMGCCAAHALHFCFLLVLVYQGKYLKKKEKKKGQRLHNQVDRCGKEEA